MKCREICEIFILVCFVFGTRLQDSTAAVNYSPRLSPKKQNFFPPGHTSHHLTSTTTPPLLLLHPPLVARLPTTTQLNSTASFYQRMAHQLPLHHLRPCCLNINDKAPTNVSTEPASTPQKSKKKNQNSIREKQQQQPYIDRN